MIFLFSAWASKKSKKYFIAKGALLLGKLQMLLKSFSSTEWIATWKAEHQTWDIKTNRVVVLKTWWKMKSKFRENDLQNREKQAEEKLCTTAQRGRHWQYGTMVLKIQAQIWTWFRTFLLITLFSLQGGLLRNLQHLRSQLEGYTHKPRSHGCLAFIRYVQPGKTPVMFLGSQNFPVAHISIIGFYCGLSEHLSVL